MAKIIDFINEALKRGNTRPLELFAEQNTTTPHEEQHDPWYSNHVVTNEPMAELSDIHRCAGFRSRREYFWQLSNMYQMDVNLIQHWALELGTENDFTLLIERIHENWDPGI